MNLALPHKNLTKVSALLLAVTMLYILQNYMKFGDNVGYDFIRSFSFNLILIGGFVVTIPLIKAINQFVSNFEWRVSFGLHVLMVIGLIFLYVVISSLILFGLGFLSRPLHEGFMTKYFSNVVIVHLLSYLLIVKTLNSNAPKRESLIEVMKGKKKIRIKPKEILFVQSLDHYVKIRTHDDTYLKKTSMSNMLIALGTETFVRIHRSYIINKNEVTRIINDSGQYEVEIDTHQLRVGKTYLAQLKSDPSFTYL